MKSAITAMAVLALIGTQTWAAETAAPLAPGKPAGVQEAQHHHFPLLLTIGAAALVVAGIVVATQTSGNANCNTCSTVVTGTSP